MRRRRWPAVVPFLLLAGTTALLAQQVQERMTAPPPTTDLSVPTADTGSAGDTEAAAAPERPPRFDAPPRGSFEVAVGRNLFSTDRRPPPLKADDDASQTVQRQPLRATLAGVVLADAQRMAMVVDKDTGRLTRLSPGDRFKGWRLVRIEPNAATFSRGSREETLSMAFASGAGVTGQPDGTATQSAAKPSGVTGGNMRSLRRARQGGMDRDPTRSLLYTEQRRDGDKPVRANRMPEVPDYDYPERPGD